MDYEFVIDRVDKGPHARAQRRAVFGPVFRDWKTSTVARMEALRKIWHGRLYSLAEAGWAPALEVPGQYLRNCPPFGAKSTPRAYPCHRTLLCPFCWARDVAGGVYDALKVAPDGGTLYEFCRTTFVPYGRQSDGSKVVFGSAVDTVRDGVRDKRTRREDLDLLPRHDVGAVVFSVSPVKGGLELRRNTVVVTSRRVRPAVKAKATAVVSAPEPKDLVASVGRVCAYPAKMLTASPKAVMPLLAGLTGVRMRAAYGTKGWDRCFRKQEKEGADA